MNIRMLRKDQREGSAMRNKPCVCGSNIKYKKCCWSKFNTTERLTVLGTKDLLKRMRYAMMKVYRLTGKLMTKEEAYRYAESGAAVSK